MAKAFNIEALAGALIRLLRKPGTFDRPSVGGFFRDGLYFGPRGSYSGNAKNLMENLTCDEAYMEIVNRPHDGRALRGFLKRAAEELHAKHGVVVSLFGDRIQLSLVQD